MANLRPLETTARDSTISDDEPLYDAVASDDDYAALAPVPQQVIREARRRATKNNSFG